MRLGMFSLCQLGLISTRSRRVRLLLRLRISRPILENLKKKGERSDGNRAKELGLIVYSL